MKTLNRVLLSLVLAVGIAVVWSWVSRTSWAETVSLLGVGEDYDNALQPLVKVAAAIIVMVAITQLVQRAHTFVSSRVLNRPSHGSHRSARMPSS